uniref:Uncharacterized protein n=1 Tax=Parascaris equorum TaxID=6256 RepID=A0A914S111_PAREQ
MDAASTKFTDGATQVYIPLLKDKRVERARFLRGEVA